MYITIFFQKQLSYKNILNKIAIIHVKIFKHILMFKQDSKK